MAVDIQDPSGQISTQELDEKLRSARTVRRRFEADAFLNLAFYAGNQWMAWDGTMLYEPQLESWRELVTDNRIRPIIRTEIAKMTKTKPKWIGTPKSQADSDVQAARYAEMALDDAWNRHGMVRKLRAALLWARICGVGYWKIWWDPTLGAQTDVLVYGADHAFAGDLIRDQAGGPMKDEAQIPQGLPYEKKTVAQGDICIELRSFFQVFVDPLCSDEGLESAEWLFEEAIYSKEYCRNHFPDFMDRLQFDTNPPTGVSEARMPFSGVYDTSTQGTEKGCKVREFWSKTQHIIYSGETILVSEPNPFPWLPYVMFRGIPVPGRFYSDAVVTDLRPRQVDLNKRLSQIADNAERIGNPPLLVPSTMGDDFNWNGLAGERIDYQDTGSPNAMPSFMGVPELPSYIPADIDRTLASMMDISGQHEVSSGQVPAGVTAASAISMLQEADDTRLGPDIGDMEEALTHAGRRILFFIRNYYTDSRNISIAGLDGVWDVYAFKGALTNGCEDIAVQAGSGMPESKAAKQAAIQQMATLFAQNGQVVDARDWRKMLSEFQVGGLEAFFASIGRDEQQVNEENRLLSQGQELPINSYDNDAAHVEFHTDFQKTSRYSMLDPGAKQVMEMHVQAHRMRIAQTAMAQQQQATPAGPPPPGGVPSPEQQQQPPTQ